MTKLDTCKYRFGLTGTLDGTQTHRLVLEGLFGKAKYVITTKELIDDKTLANLKIDCIILKYPDEDRQIVKDFEYAAELEYIVTKTERNYFLCDLMGHHVTVYTCLSLHMYVSVCACMYLCWMPFISCPSLNSSPCCCSDNEKYSVSEAGA